MASLIRVQQAPTVARGPGRWLVLRREEALVPKVPRPVVGFCCIVALVVAVSVMVLGATSNALLLELFLLLGALPSAVGRELSSLTKVGQSRARRVLGQVARQLEEDPRFRVIPRARIPDGCSEPDEVRLSLQLQSVRRGLLGFEIGVESSPHGVQIPYVLLRVVDGDGPHLQLGSSVLWVRGRSSEERVARVFPRFPTIHATAQLVCELVTRLTELRVKTHSNRAIKHLILSTASTP